VKLKGAQKAQDLALSQITPSLRIYLSVNTAFLLIIFNHSV
jgi:hypothetical protein